MSPKMTKFLGYFLPVIIGAISQPDIHKIWEAYPTVGNLVAGLAMAIAGYLGIGVSGPTVAPRVAAALGNPGAPPPSP